MEHMIAGEGYDEVQSDQTETIVGLLTHDAKRVRLTALGVVEHLLS